MGAGEEAEEVGNGRVQENSSGDMGPQLFLENGGPVLSVLTVGGVTAEGLRDTLALHGAQHPQKANAPPPQDYEPTQPHTSQHASAPRIACAALAAEFQET